MEKSVQAFKSNPSLLLATFTRQQQQNETWVIKMLVTQSNLN